MMKNYLSLFLFLALSTTGIAQITAFKKAQNDSINRWSLDISAGQSKGVGPYSTGYFSSNRDQFFGNPEINYFNAAARYMFSPKFGISFGLGMNKIENNSNSKSLPFQMNQTRFAMQGVVNAMRLFDVQDAMGRVGLLFHGGLEAAISTPKIGINKDVKDYNGGIIIGVTPQYRISKKVSIFGDVTAVRYYRQHLNWNGLASENNQNLSGNLISYSLGLSFSFGNSKMHGDWAKLPNATTDLKPIEKRLQEMESKMQDTDQDGVADYLDVENNSARGVMVDVKGRTIDRNSNGIADELEKYLENKGGTAPTSTQIAPETTDMVAKFINDGFVAVYFGFNEASPSNDSNQAINLIVNYLKNNPNQSISIIGSADAKGDAGYNKDLSERRANNVRSILIKSGIAPERFNIVSNGEDNSVDESSEYARKLVRRVYFKVN